MNKRCFVIGGGNSLAEFDFSRLENEITIAVNGACFYVPNVNYVIWSDIDFWPKHRKDIQTKIPEAELWTTDLVHCLPPYQGVNVYTRTDKFIEKQNPLKMELYGGQKGYLTGVLALSFAIAKELGTVYILGYDCKTIEGSNHFHAHSKPDDKFSHTTGLYDPLKGKDIINCGPDSNLEVFPKINIDEVLNDNGYDSKQGKTGDIGQLHSVNSSK